MASEMMLLMEMMGLVPYVGLVVVELGTREDGEKDIYKMNFQFASGDTEPDGLYLGLWNIAHSHHANILRMKYNIHMPLVPPMPTVETLNQEVKWVDNLNREWGIIVDKLELGDPLAPGVPQA